MLKHHKSLVLIAESGETPVIEGVVLIRFLGASDSVVMRGFTLVPGGPFGFGRFDLRDAYEFVRFVRLRDVARSTHDRRDALPGEESRLGAEADCAGVVGLRHALGQTHSVTVLRQGQATPQSSYQPVGIDKLDPQIGTQLR